MSYRNRDNNSFFNSLIEEVVKKLSRLDQRIWGIIIAVTAFSILYVLWTPNRPLKPVLNAVPFIWPKGCPNVNYKYANNRGDSISCACKDEKNRINDWMERGLRNRNKVIDEWYRVGNYALSIRNNNGLFNNSGCAIRDAQEDFFISDQSGVGRK